MENNLINHLQRVCKNKISTNGTHSKLSLETFFCDNSIDIKQFAELTDWWFNKQKLSYLISADNLLSHINEIRPKQLIPKYNQILNNVNS
jgi:hypothetical protein